MTKEEEVAQKMMDVYPRCPICVHWTLLTIPVKGERVKGLCKSNTYLEMHIDSETSCSGFRLDPNQLAVLKAYLK